MPVAARAIEVLADLAKAVRHQATSGLAFFGEAANDSSSHWLAGAKPSKLIREVPFTVVWLIFTTPRSPARDFLIDFLASEQVRIVEEVAQEPAQLPQCFGRAVNATRDHTSSKRFRFENAEAKDVERFLRIPSILSLIDAHEEHSVGHMVRSRRRSFAETLNATSHATPSFSLLDM
jgi:hypothetical protein